MRMKTGITRLSLIPVRASHNERSEQVTQLLFGEPFEVLQTSGNWLKIRSLCDDYEGWIDRVMAGTLQNGDEPVFPETVVFQNLINHVFDNQNQPMIVGGGCRIPKPDAFNKFILVDKEYQVAEGQESCFTPAFDLTETALKFLNTPYLWGGKSLQGIDCSGFTQLVFRMHGIELPRDASQQVDLGETICFRHDAKPGDVAFFENKKGNIVHVGIILDDQHIIHASGNVRIDKLDHSGIYNTELQRYTHEMSVIKKVL